MSGKKKATYSDARIWQIFRALQKRGMAMFLGISPKTGEPMMWMQPKSNLAHAPISIATAEMLLDEIMDAEMDWPGYEVLIGEVLDAMPARKTVTIPLRLPAPALEGAI